MTSTYVNDLRLNEMATGDQSGSWGTVTNTNLELISEAFSFGTEAITTNADTHTTTIADGATDPGRSMFLKYTGTLDSACTITIAPNTVSKLWFIENATGGSQSIIIKQGSGATITIATGQTKAIYSDGAGSGGKMVDAFDSLSVGALASAGAVSGTTGTFSGAVAGTTGTFSGAVTGASATFDGGVDIDNINIDGTTIALSSGGMTISGADDITLDAVGDVILSCDGDQVKFDDGTTTRFTFNLDATPTMGMGTLTLFENEIDVDSGNLTLDVAGNINLDADGGSITLKDGGVSFGTLFKSSNNLIIYSTISDGDIKFQGNDGGSDITALTLDMSEAGAATFNSTIAAGAATFTTADNTDTLSLISTDADAGVGPNLNLYRNSGSPADDDFLGKINFTGRNDNSQDVDYGYLAYFVADASDGTEDAFMQIGMIKGGTTSLVMEATATETVFNQSSVDLDFRVESDTGTHALFVQGSDGNVGVGTSSPSADFVVSNGGAAGIELQPEIATDTNRITNYDRATSAYMNFRLDGLTHQFLTSGTARMDITSAGAKNFGAHESESGGFNIFAGAGSAASFAARFEGTGTGASNVVQITNGYGDVGSIKIAADGTTTNYNTGSDYRLKTDVQPVADASARIQSLNPVNFEWVRSGTRTDGFLAHEAQAVVPDCVSGDKDAMKDEGYEVTPAVLDDDGNVTTEAVMGTRSVPDYQGIDQSKLVPLLTAALQEALAKIDAMETRLTALEG